MPGKCCFEHAIYPGAAKIRQIPVYVCFSATHSLVKNLARSGGEEAHRAPQPLVACP